MGIERQNIQMRLAFPEGEWGEASRDLRGRDRNVCGGVRTRKPGGRNRTTCRTAVYGPVRTVV